MSAGELDALLASTNGDSLRGFHDIASTHVSIADEISLRPCFERCLQAFCDISFRPEKRRWIGIILRKLIHGSSEVVKHLDERPDCLKLLINTITNCNELSEIKFIACMIMRQALISNSTLESLWPSAPLPKYLLESDGKFGKQWLESILEFLYEDAQSSQYAGGHVPVSIIASDANRWIASDLQLSMAFVSEEQMTIMISNQGLTTFTFVDIPLDSVQSTTVVKSNLHDSQARTSDYVPGDLVIRLGNKSTVYRIDSKKQSTPEIRIMFTNIDDANELKQCIEAAIIAANPNTQNSTKNKRQSSNTLRMSRSSILRLGHQSPTHSKYQNRKSLKISPPDEMAQSRKRKHTPDPDLCSIGRLSDDELEEKTRKRQKGPQYDGDPAMSKVPGLDDRELAPQVLVTGGQTQHPLSIGPNRPAGSLPKIKRAKQMKTFSAGHSHIEGDTFEFPADSGNLRRPVKRSKGESIRKPAKRARVSIEKAPVAQTMLNGAQDAEDSQDEVESTLDQQSGSDAAPGAGHSAKELSAIPKRKRSNNVKRSSLRAAKKVNYDEGESSSDGKSDPDFVIANSKKFRSPDRIRKSAKPKKSTRNLGSSKKSIQGKAIQPNATLQSISAKKHSTLANLLAKDQPQPPPSGQTAETQHAKRKTEAAATPPIKTKNTRDGSTLPGTDNHHEASVLSRLNDNDDNMSIGDLHATIEYANKQSTNGDSSESRLYQDVEGPPNENDAQDGRPDLHENEHNPLHDYPLDDVHEEHHDDYEANDVHEVYEEVDEEAHEVYVDVHEGVHKEARVGNKKIRKETHKAHEDSNEELHDESHDPHNTTIHDGGEQSRQLATHADASRPDDIHSMPPPATPTRRIDFKARNSHLNDAFAVSPSSIAPLRIVDDPSSPCDNRTRARQPSKDIAPISYDELKPSHSVQRGTSAMLTQIATHEPSSAGRVTPSQQDSQRQPSSGSSVVQVLSSNSKPLPGNPTADSQAISGHDDIARVEEVKALADRQITRIDPFTKSSHSAASNPFTRRLTTISSGGPKPPVEAKLLDQAAKTATEGLASATLQRKPVQEDQQNSESPVPMKGAHAQPKEKNSPGIKQKVHAMSTKGTMTDQDLPVDSSADGQTMEMHNDETLVNQAESPLKASPLHLNSSPPVLDGTWSTQSSTSAEGNTPASDASILTEDAEQLEWEEHLKPHQRALSGQLLRVSRRVLRHIVDNETAVTDIVEMYHKNGQEIVDDFVNRSDEELMKILGTVEADKASMRTDFQRAADNVREERRRSNDTSISNGYEMERNVNGKRKAL